MRIVAAIFFLLLLGSPAAVYAQPAAVAPGDVVRFNRTLGGIAGEKGVSVWLHRAPDAKGWQLRLVDRTRGKAVGVTTLPEWVGADYYGYSVSVRGFGNVVVVLFEAAPAPGVEAPPSAESYQIAWAYGVRRKQRNPVWIEVASTQNSPLDGGDRLVVRKEDGKETLVRLRTAEDTRFCGADLAAYQIFNPEEISFKSKLDLDALTDKAEKVSARLLEEDFTELTYPLFSLWYSATSDRYNADDSRTVIRPLEVGDSDPGTAWMEGAEGLGKGEFVTARINDALKIRGLRVAAGHLGSEEEYAAHAKPRRLLVSLGDGSRFAVDLPETPFEVAKKRGGHVIWFPAPIRSACMSVILVDAEAGAPAQQPEDAWKQRAVAISELAPISELHGLAREVAALVVVEKLLKEADRGKSRRLVQLTSPLANELVKVLQDVLESGSHDDRVRVIPLLRSLPSEASVPVLVRMFEEAEPDEEAYMLVKPALAAHRESAARELLTILEERPPENERKYTDLTRLIGRLGGPEQLSRLMAFLGEGRTRVRNERVRAVAAGGEKMLSPLFAIARDSVDTPRGHDALLAINAIGRRLFFRGQGEYEGSGILMTVADKARQRRSIMLTMKALGFFATEGAIELLEEFSRHASDPLIRKQAVEAVAHYPDRPARGVLEASLLDTSPDVRIAAIDGLSQRTDRRQALPSIQTYVRKESWRPGLEVGYAILAELGDDRFVQDLAATIAKEPSSVRAQVAAEALTRAKRPVPSDLAERLLYSTDTSLRMRRNLVDSLGVGIDLHGERVLQKLISSENSFADLEPRKGDRLRQRAVLALGRRDSPGGHKTLLAMVGDGSASNDIRAIALRGLAFSRNREILPRLEMLREDAPADLQDAFDQTIDLVGRRAAIQELEDGIEDVEQKRTETPRTEKREKR